MTTYSGTKEFEGAAFVKASFKGATLRFSDVSGVTMRSADVDGLDIDSHDLFFGSLFVNGVDVVPLVDAELNRQFPGRELLKAQTPEGLREGWVAVQSAWQTTVAGTPPDLVDAHVDERAEGRDVRDLALQQHPRLQVGDLVHALGEGGRAERRTRVAAGLLQLGQDVGDGRQAEGVVNEPEPIVEHEAGEVLRR